QIVRQLFYEAIVLSLAQALWVSVSRTYREVETPRFDLYLPYRQAPNQVQHFMVRLSGDPLSAVPALRSAVAALDPEARIDGISTMEEVVGRAFAPWRFSSIVVSAFAAIALTFAVVSIATLVAFRRDPAHARNRGPSRARCADPRRRYTRC
ncbi:MAG: hypothetical protein ABI818_15945, partial [Acidobacteriota bacterium]